MNKSDAVASLGEDRLLLPAWVRAALGANDRIKLYLTAIQTAAQQAANPQDEPADLAAEMRTAGVEQRWIESVPSSASLVDGQVLIPELHRLVRLLADDLDVLARPAVQLQDADAITLRPRVAHWHTWLHALPQDRLDTASLRQLTHGNRDEGDSFHILVMDLHKYLNQLSVQIATEEVDGAHCWQLRPHDRLRVSAFMRGLNRTAPLKLDHPGLETAATSEKDRLLIQNDIGTNDAHVLVIQVVKDTVTMTYSDLHSTRFAFFQKLLEELGATWSVVEPRVTPGLNKGEAYQVGTATFRCIDETSLCATLEGIGARIVFLIDWNRARKRLQSVVGKGAAITVLTEAARNEWGHMPWLKAGGDRLVFEAMQAAGSGVFRLGDKLADVIGPAATRDYLIELMRISSQAALAGSPAALVNDEARLVLVRMLQDRTPEFDLINEHAGYCHAIAQAVSDSLSHNQGNGDGAALQLASRAKGWERSADHILMEARNHAERQAQRWQPVVRLLEQLDDVADALEESAFLLSLPGAEKSLQWTPGVRRALAQLAETVLGAVQEFVKAVTVASTLDTTSGSADSDAFFAAAWGVMRAERQCDGLLRDARRLILVEVTDMPALIVANDLAVTLETASDRLLAAGHGLRDMAFSRTGATA